MYFIRFGLLLCFLTFAHGAKVKPWRTEKKFQIEILSKNQTSIQARFRPLRRVQKYFVSVGIKYLADARSPFTAKLKKKRDRNSDGYYYVDTKNVLEPGKRYELSVFRLRQHRLIKNIDVFTDCDEYSYQCETSYGQTCLNPSQMCDGTPDCLNGSDEEKVGEKCAVTLPEPRAPPFPPMDTPCMKNLTAVLDRARRNSTELSGLKRPSCGIDGNYSPMDCDIETSTCYCVHPLTAEILQTQTNFHPFIHWNFTTTCQDKANQKLAEQRKGNGGKDVDPEVEPPNGGILLPEILPPFGGPDGFVEPPPPPPVLPDMFQNSPFDGNSMLGV